MDYQTQKRILDLVVASGLILVFLPVWILVPIMIYFDSGWPVFFNHRRVGLGGMEFNLHKFRSMIHDADDLLHKHDKELLEHFIKNDWKIENDPRITKLGKLLRSLTIDEFPQLINVIKGEMSMVGPRAYVKKELLEQSKRYPETKQYIKYIVSVKPGITGVWQTSGRNEIPFAARAKMDAAYVQRQSIWEDISILFKTPQAMISKW